MRLGARLYRAAAALPRVRSVPRQTAQAGCADPAPPETRHDRPCLPDRVRIARPLREGRRRRTSPTTSSNYAFSNCFEIASKAKPYEKVVFGQNQIYVLEAIRAEGSSPWYTCAHDEFALVHGRRGRGRTSSSSTPSRPCPTPSTTAPCS